MKKLTLFAVIILSFLATNAQVDTVFTYYNLDKQVGNKDSAVTYTKQYPLEGLWVKEYYNASKNSLNMRASYLNKDYKTLQGIWDDFYADGTIRSRKFYENNQLAWGKYFYPNGKLNGEGIFDANGKIVKQEGYDTSGNVIKGYVFFKESEFKGGMDGWISYLQTHLNVNLPSKNGAPFGKYTVMVSFVVEKDGSVTNITTTDDPGFGTKEEAIRIIKYSPRWKPAIDNNQFVISRKRQSITFLVQ